MREKSEKDADESWIISQKRQKKIEKGKNPLQFFEVIKGDFSSSIKRKFVGAIDQLIYSGSTVEIDLI